MLCVWATRSPFNFGLFVYELYFLPLSLLSLFRSIALCTASWLVAQLIHSHSFFLFFFLSFFLPFLALSSPSWSHDKAFGTCRAVHSLHRNKIEKERETNLQDWTHWCAHICVYLSLSLSLSLFLCKSLQLQFQPTQRQTEKKEK